MSKLRGWFRDYRFLVALVALLIAFALISALLTRSPGSTWKDAWRALGPNLAAESLGAVISIAVIGWFLKRHEEQSLQRVRVLALRRIHSLSYNTIERCVGVIPQPGQDDPIDALAFVGFLRLIAGHDIPSAIAKLSDVFGQSPSIKHPETFRRIQGLASDLQSEWTDSLDMFQQYLTPDQFAGIVRIIEHLESLAFQCGSMEKLLEIVGGANASTDLEFAVADSVMKLNEQVLRLLQLCSQ